MDFSDEDIRAVVKSGEHSDPGVAETIAKTLIERRDIIARYWLARANPLDGFSFSGGKLTFKDLAVRRGFATKEGTVYHAEVTGTGPEVKNLKIELKEPTLDLEPQRIPSGGEIQVVIRVARSSSRPLSPAITVRLNSSGIQGIHRED
jgi:hypothetical protein